MHTEHGHGSHKPHVPFDSEISVSGIVWFKVGLTVLSVGVFVFLWLAYNRYQTHLLARSGARSPLAEANEPRPRAAIRVQENPLKAMQELSARDTQQLTTYGWVDKQAGVARIPIKRAMEIVAEKGLPSPAPPVETAGEKPASAAPAGEK